MRMARRAGTAQAISPMTASTAHTASQVRGSVGSTPRADSDVSQGDERAGQADGRAQRHEPRAAHDDQIQNRAGRRAQREPQPDFDRPLPRAYAITPYRPTAASSSAIPLSSPTNVAIVRWVASDRSNSSTSRRGLVSARRGSISRTAWRTSGRSREDHRSFARAA